jgi:alpha-L-fucosidase
MKSKIILLTIVLFITNVTHSFGQTKIDSEEIADKMQWFADAKLGIFIHTGIYAFSSLFLPFHRMRRLRQRVNK